MDYKQGPRRLAIAILIAFTALFYSKPFWVDAQTVTSSQQVTITAIVSNAGTVGAIGGGGGGGGGGGATTPTNPIPTAGDNVIFKGLAYPGSIVTLLKNGSVVTEVPASPDASFQISLSGLTPGTYNFGVKAQDSDGQVSPVQMYTIKLENGVTTLINGLIFPPTLALDKSEVKRGDVLVVFGKALPKATVTAIFNSTSSLIKQTSSDVNGGWVYKLDTLQLEEGDHQVKVRSQNDTDITPFSESYAFKVGLRNVANAEKIKLTKLVPESIDLSHDGKINISDFSILAYWFAKPNPPKAVDLNHDGKVSLVDFSILAYYWTG